MSTAPTDTRDTLLAVCSQADPRRVVASAIIDLFVLVTPGVLAYVLPGPAIARLLLVLGVIAVLVLTCYAHMLHGRAVGGALLGLRTVDRSAGLPTGTYEAIITPWRGGRSAHAVTLSTRPGPDPARGTLAALSQAARTEPAGVPTPPEATSSAPVPSSPDTAIRPGAAVPPGVMGPTPSVPLSAMVPNGPVVADTAPSAALTPPSGTLLQPAPAPPPTPAPAPPSAPPSPSETQVLSEVPAPSEAPVLSEAPAPPSAPSTPPAPPAPPSPDPASTVTITSLPAPAPHNAATALPPLLVTRATPTRSLSSASSAVAPPPPSAPPPPTALPSAAPASPSSPVTLAPSPPSVTRRSTRTLLAEGRTRSRTTSAVTSTAVRAVGAPDLPRADPVQTSVRPVQTSVRMEPLALPTPPAPPVPSSPVSSLPTASAPPALAPPPSIGLAASPPASSPGRHSPASPSRTATPPSPSSPPRHALPPTSRTRTRSQSPARHAATPEPAAPSLPPQPEWRIRMVDDNGWQAVITRPTILGRALRRRSGSADTALLTVPDTSESASKEHAMLSIRNHLLIVTDLGSVNGTTIRMRDGRTYPCTAHQPVATPLPSVISLGGYQLSLTEE